KIRLKKGDKFLQCPFFTNNKCTVYDVVPFDCRLWPFCVMRSEDKKKIVLAMDTVETCSALENVKEKQLKKYSEYLSKELQKKEYLDFFKKNPKLIWDYDWELKILCDLKKLKGL
ncbi:MAG: hypothetical protein GY861_06505, partial [bacterium]|nr:hypothetical protein [bacterium]